jgi:hypothetical protein
MYWNSRVVCYPAPYWIASDAPCPYSAGSHSNGSHLPPCLPKTSKVATGFPCPCPLQSSWGLTPPKSRLGQGIARWQRRNGSAAVFLADGRRDETKLSGLIYRSCMKRKDCWRNPESLTGYLALGLPFLDEQSRKVFDTVPTAGVRPHRLIVQIRPRRNQDPTL